MRKGLYLILILLFPSIIYMLFSLGEHRIEKIGSYGNFRIDERNDTVYQPIPDMLVTDHDGQEWMLSELQGKPFILDFIASPCDEPCKKKGVTLVNYLNELSERDKWSMVSVVMDTGVSITTLKELQLSHFPEMSNWRFVKPAFKADLERLLAYVFVETQRVKGLSNLPSTEVAIIDQKGVIRSYFDTRIHKENKKLEDAIKVLLKEPHMSWKNQKS